MADETAPEDNAHESPPAFEAALDELEALVQKMESGDLSLEESLAAFERGVTLTRHCQEALKRAELKVKVLTADNETEALEGFEEDDTEFDEH